MGHFAVIFASFTALAMLAGFANFMTIVDGGPTEKQVKRHIVCFGIAAMSQLGLVVFGIGWIVGRLA